MIYLIAPLAVLHYAWGKKGDFFRLQGEIILPLIYGLIVIIFLIMRIPQVRKGSRFLTGPDRGPVPKARASTENRCCVRGLKVSRLGIANAKVWRLLDSFVLEYPLDKQQ